MPRLPDIDTLGRRPIPSAVPAIASYKAGIAEAAQAEYAGTLASVGHGIVAAGKDLARAQIAIDEKAASEARAEARERDQRRAATGAFLRLAAGPAAASERTQPALPSAPGAPLPEGLVDPSAGLPATPSPAEPEAASQRPSPEFLVGQRAILAEGIAHPIWREVFLADTQVFLDRLRADDGEQRERAALDERRRSMTADFAANIEAAQHIRDPALRMALIANTTERLQGAVEDGTMTAGEAQAFRGQWGGLYAERWLNGLPAREQFALLRDAHAGSGGGLGAMLDVDADDEVIVGGEGHDVLIGGAAGESGNDILGSTDADKLRIVTLDERMKALGLDWRRPRQLSIANTSMPPHERHRLRAGEDMKRFGAEIAYNLIKPVILPGHVLEGGEWSPNDVTDLALTVSGAGGVIGKAPAGALGMAAARKAALDMSEGARMARAQKAGYSSEPFYRGQKAPAEEGDIQFYSRDPETSKGFGEVKEYRLAIKKPLHFGQEITLGDYVAVMHTVAKQSPKAAAEMAAGVPLRGEWTMERLSKVAEKQGGVEIMNGASLHQIVETLVGDAVAPLRAAGYDAIDTGRDVRMLTKRGQRLKGAAFDPDKAKSTDLRASLDTKSSSA